MKNMRRKIGAYIMVLVLVGTLVPVLGGVKADNSVADGTKVAKIGTNEYETLQAAAEAVTGSDEVTIQLINDVDTGANKALWVGDGKKIKLDLNGHTITSSCEYYTINIAKNNYDSVSDEKTTGELTIVGNGTIKNTSPGSTTIRNYGKLILGELYADDSGFVVENTDKTGTDNSTVRCEAGAELKIYSGTYRASMASNTGTNTNSNLQCSGKVTICGGKFESYLLLYKEADNVPGTNNIELNLQGGIFESYIRPLMGQEGQSNGLAMEYLHIYGGKFKLSRETVAKGHSNSGEFNKYDIYDRYLENATVWPSEPGADGYYHVHSHDQSVKVDAKEPTCTEPGITKGHKCSICGIVRDGAEVIPATGHTMSDLKIAKEPTRHEKGYYSHYQCTKCNKYYEDAAGTKELTAEQVIRPALVDVVNDVVTVDKSILSDAITKKEVEDDVATVTVSLKDVDKSATTINLPVEGVKEIANCANDVTVIYELPNGMLLAFDKDSTNLMVAESKTAEYITLSMKKIEAKDMTEKQQAALKDEDVQMVVSASIECDGKKLSSFGDGYAVVAIPFVGDSKSEYSVIYVADDGKVEPMFSDYDTYQEGTYMMFLTSHFSEFAVVKEEGTSSGGSSGSGGSTGIYDDDDDDGSTSGGTKGSGTTAGKVSNVPTGDEANMTLWISLLVVSVVALGTVIIFVKKKKIWK